MRIDDKKKVTRDVVVATKGREVVASRGEGALFRQNHPYVTMTLTLDCLVGNNMQKKKSNRETASLPAVETAGKSTFDSSYQFFTST